MSVECCAFAAAELDGSALGTVRDERLGELPRVEIGRECRSDAEDKAACK